MKAKRSAERRSPTAGNRGRGSHWIRDEKRRRIYERDGWRCVWCCCDVRAGNDPERSRLHYATACLDHVLPREQGGSNDAGNLVTSCLACNEKRGHRSAIEFAYETAFTDGRKLFEREPSNEWATGRAAFLLNQVLEALGRELPPARPRGKAA